MIFGQNTVLNDTKSQFDGSEESGEENIGVFNSKLPWDMICLFFNLWKQQ
jgi:hypothetical protein